MNTSLITVGRDEPQRPLFAAIPAMRAVKRGRVDRAKLIPWADWKSGLGDDGQGGALWSAFAHYLSVSQFFRASGPKLGGIGQHGAHYVTEFLEILLSFGAVCHGGNQTTGQRACSTQTKGSRNP